jgi:hypothetical protein
MKILHGFLAFMFLSFAAVQYNDPDPFLWIFIYLAMVALCVLAIFRKFYPMVMGALAIGFMIYASLLSPGVYDWFMSDDRSLLFDDIAKMQYYYIEEAREFLGLMICLATLVFYVILSRKSAKAGL